MGGWSTKPRINLFCNLALRKLIWPGDTLELVPTAGAITSIGKVGCAGATDQPQNPAAEPVHSVQLLSHVRLFATPWTAARQAFLMDGHNKEG